MELNIEICTRKFRGFWADPLQHTAANYACPITDTDSVLCTPVDHAVLCSLWNIITAFHDSL